MSRYSQICNSNGLGKERFKQWCSTILPISTTPTTTSYKAALGVDVYVDRYTGDLSYR
jgi:hypothetical protein